jgi:hypothetical protein
VNKEAVAQEIKHTLQSPWLSAPAISRLSARQSSILQTELQFPGNIIPSNRINPQATAFFRNFLPAPNVGNQTYTFPDFGTLAMHQGITKVDDQLTSKDLVFARYYIDDVPQVGFASGSGSALDTK